MPVNLGCQWLKLSSLVYGFIITCKFEQAVNKKITNRKQTVNEQNTEQRWLLRIARVCTQGGAGNSGQANCQNLPELRVEAPQVRMPIFGNLSAEYVRKLRPSS